MLYELRRYRVDTGAMAAMHERMQNILMPLFEQCGVPRPLAIWEATGGCELPLLVWILRWDTFEQRQAAWAELYPRWQKIRPTSVNAEEFVLHTSVTLMTPWPELPAAEGGLGTGAGELWLRKVAATQAGGARRTFLQSELPVLQRAGANLKGGFDLMFGEALPKLAIFLEWPDEATRSAGLSAYDNAAEIASAHRRDKVEYGRPVTELTQRVPLRPVSYL